MFMANAKQSFHVVDMENYDAVLACGAIRMRFLGLNNILRQLCGALHWATSPAMILPSKDTRAVPVAITLSRLRSPPRFDEVGAALKDDELDYVAVVECAGAEQELDAEEDSGVREWRKVLINEADWIMDKDRPQRLLPVEHRPHHRITVIPGATPRKAKPRRLSKVEYEESAKIGHYDAVRMDRAESKRMASHTRRKRNGQTRLCFNYAPLNDMSEDDAYPLADLRAFTHTAHLLCGISL